MRLKGEGKMGGAPVPPSMGGQNSEGVLAAFFNNLLKNKAGPNGQPLPPGVPSLNNSLSSTLSPKIMAREAELPKQDRHKTVDINCSSYSLCEENFPNTEK